MPETIYVASAGTGKTTTLLNKLEEILEHTPPDRIAYTTYTNAGANEAVDRACEKFKLNPEDFKYFRTLHSLCYRNIRRLPIMQYSDYMEFGKEIGYPISAAQALKPGLAPAEYQNRGTKLLAMDNLKRNRIGSTYEEICAEAGQTDRSETPEVLKHFCESYKRYKIAVGKMDFTDMLESFLAQEYTPDLDYVFGDEAQDFSKLQWAVMDLLSAKAKHMYIAGDDKQAIYEFSGGCPESLINRTGERIVLDTCYRLPKTILSFAENVAQRIKLKTDYHVATNNLGGSVHHVQNFNHIDMKQGSWLLLARNRSYLPIFESAVISQGYLFKSIYNDMIPNHAIPAVKAWNKLIKGGLISADQAKLLYKHYLPTGKRVARGFKKVVASLPEDELLDFDNMVQNYGLLCDNPWWEALEMPPKLVAYLRNAFEKEDDEERIEINTIHGTKGREADNVVVLPDMSWTTWNAYRNNPDREHRVFYVACTRAKENLFIHQPISDNFYQYPRQ